MAKREALKVLPHIKILCPTSGLEVEGVGRIAPHYMTAHLCRSGTAIYSTCPLHWVKSFINEPQLVEKINGQNSASSTASA